MPDFGTSVGCQGKVDVIFAVSARWSMEVYQERLLEAFPAFAEALETELGGFDVHALVTDAGGWWGFGDCADCQDPADCDPLGEPPLCGATIDACDQTLGAGVTFPSFGGSSGRRCDLAGGRRYITAEEPDLPSAFQCLAQIGVPGSMPIPLDAILSIVGQSLNHDVELNGPGGCNEGFLRDDALLLFVIIQNHYDEVSFGLPWQWAQGLYTAKGGNEDAVFGLAITTDRDVWNGLCPGGLIPFVNPMRTFMEEWLRHGRMASICAPYGPVFQEVASELAVLCDSFIPQ